MSWCQKVKTFSFFHFLTSSFLWFWKNTMRKQGFSWIRNSKITTLFFFFFSLFLDFHVEYQRFFPRITQKKYGDFSSFFSWLLYMIYKEHLTHWKKSHFFNLGFLFYQSDMATCFVISSCLRELNSLFSFSHFFLLYMRNKQFCILLFFL